MSFEMLDPQQVIIDLLTKLPPGENPWPYIRATLWDSYIPDVSASCEYQLYVISVLLAICLLFVILSLVVRVYTRTFWVVRFGAWTDLWRPHWSISWSLWAVALCALLQGQLWASVQYIKKDSIVHGYIAWRVFVWMAAWFGGWTATWSLGISFIAHLEANGKIAVTSRLALLLNLAAFLVPLVYTACLVPFAIDASKKYDALMKTFQVLLDEIDRLDTSYSGTFSLIELADKIPLVTRMQSATNEMLESLRKTFIVLGTSGVFLLLTLVPIAALHIRSLHRVLRESTSMSATLQSSGSRETALQRSYKNLKWTVISFSCIDACFTAICFHIVIDTFGSLTKSLPMELEILAPLWIFAVFGIPTSILLFRRSLDSLSPGGVVAYKMRTSAAEATSVDLDGTSSRNGNNKLSSGFDMVLLSNELYELGSRPVDEDVEKNAKEELSEGSIPSPPVAARQRGAAVVRDQDGWFRETSVQEIELPMRGGPGNRDSTGSSYSTSQTPHLDVADVSAQDHKAGQEGTKSPRMSALRWSGFRS